jgi:integrase/recombinase XerD
MTDLILTGTVLPSRPDEPVDELTRMTAAWILAQKSVHTRHAYRRNVTGIGKNGEPAKMSAPAWIPWCGEHGLNPLQARRGHVDAYRLILESAGCSPNTIAQRLSAISSWYDYLLDEDVTDRNPAKNATRPNIDRDESPAVGLSEQEMNDLLDQADADSTQSGALIAMLYYGGLRIGSLLNANIGDLAWDQGDRTLAIVAKGGKPRRMVIEPVASDALDAYLAERGPVADDDPLFLSPKNERLDESAAWRLVRRLAKRAGVRSWSSINPHSLRHTHITHARDEGVPMEDIQDWVGHNDPRTTERYDRARRRRDRRPGKALAEGRRRYLEKRSESLRNAEPLPQEASEM